MNKCWSIRDERILAQIGSGTPVEINFQLNCMILVLAQSLIGLSTKVFFFFIGLHL